MPLSYARYSDKLSLQSEEENRTEHDRFPQVMFRIRPVILRLSSSIIQKKELSNLDANSLRICPVCRRRNTRTYLQHRSGRQIRPDHIARLQPYLLGDHSHQMEFAPACPYAERTLSAGISQSTAPAGHRDRRRSIPSQPACGSI